MSIAVDGDSWQPAPPPTSPVFTRDTIRLSTQKRVTMLAPMVRCGTLPLRLLSMRYGADIVYTEELIAFKLRKCTRVVNTALRTVDFVCGDELVLRTCDAERNRCVVQLGVASPEVAVEAVRVM
jgi:tRNA-dihydrouridine synthase 2